MKIDRFKIAEIPGENLAMLILDYRAAVGTITKVKKDDIDYLQALECEAVNRYINSQLKDLDE